MERWYLIFLFEIRVNLSFYPFFTKIPKERDEILENEFNKLLEATSYLTHNLDFDHKVDNKPISLGHALDLVIKLQEKYVLKKQMDYHEKLNSNQKAYKDKLARVLREKNLNHSIFGHNNFLN
jgi:lysine-specific histone demethylase 1